MTSVPNTVNTANWSSCFYKNGELLAFVSLGGRPDPAGGDPRLLYFVTTSDKERQEIYQTEHEELAEAVNTLNKRYGHWDVADLRVPHKEGGCGSCSAH